MNHRKKDPVKNWKMELQLLVKRKLGNEKQKLLQLPIAAVALTRQTEMVQAGQRRRMMICSKKKHKRQSTLPAKRMGLEAVLQNNCGPFLLSSPMILELDLKSTTYLSSVPPILLNTAQPQHVRHTSFLLLYPHPQ